MKTAAIYIIGLGPNMMYSLHGTRLVALLFRTSDIYTHVLTGLQDGLPTLQPSQHRTASSADYKINYPVPGFFVQAET